MGLKKIWHSYTASERRNIAFYIAGLMLYKLSFEIWSGSLTTIALTRFHRDGEDDTDENTPVGMLGALQSLNLVFQCLGTVVVAWGLRLEWGSRSILIWTVLAGVLISGGLLGLDIGTGGRWKGYEVYGKEVYGNWDARILVLVFALAGVVAGGVELVRKVMPRVVLGDEMEGEKGEEGGEKKSVERMGNKLRRMDAMVHIFYELAGTAGAFLSAYLSLRLGSNFAVVAVPAGWLLASVVWLGMRVMRDVEELADESGFEDRKLPKDKIVKRTFWGRIWRGTVSFFTTLQLGFRLIFSTPQYAWLPLGYSLSLYAHRYLENGLAPAIAKYVYNEPAYYQIIVGGSNLGELIGALAVFLLTETIQSPLLWVRLDATVLAIIWVVVKWRPPIDESTGKVPVVWAWKLAAVFLPISLGWAAGDVSLVAHIQATLSAHELGKDFHSDPEDIGGKQVKYSKPNKQRTITSLGAVMAVLYSTYIALFALLNPLLGIYTDRVVNSNINPGDGDGRKGIWEALVNVGGIQFTIIAVLVGGSTLVPLMGEYWPWGRHGRSMVARE
ncbi:hypothetical protein BGX38DRAFT_1181080 [Terfezia claveryi]|nr:hypothetical protein BGX38DRAFT_1181080 [Terfezia claveryi]